MAEIRHVTDTFSVAPQLNAEDFPAIQAAGFRTVICNRPDGETPDQMSAGEAEARALAAGLVFRSIPFSGPPGPDQVEATAKVLKDLPGPVLAYCRTGTRSITVWAHAQARSGAPSADEIVELARGAGYDLSSQRGALGR